jgi:hypothetical protein
MPSVTVEISSGPTITVPWVAGMNAKQALEAAYNQVRNSQQFTYSLQFYGSTFGYLVSMVNETYDTFFSSSDPFFYWAFYVNGNIAPKGIDSTILKQGDVVMFQYQLYDPNQHAASQLGIKHQLHQQAAAKDS